MRRTTASPSGIEWPRMREDREPYTGMSGGDMTTSLLALGSLMEPLRGFVAVGRRMSITAAARELCLSQSALSRQVRALEERLRVKLFVRGHRSIAFTQEGERLFRVSNAALEQLQYAFGTLRAAARQAPVTLSASIGVAGLWLLPRLGRFQAAHPDVDLRVAAEDRVVDLATEGVDLAIRYGRHVSSARGAVRLFGESVVPVAHPSLGVQCLASSRDLADHVLLEFDSPGRPWLHWDGWLAAMGCPGARPRSVLRFNQYDQVVRSAIAGHGIALGRIELIRSLLDDRSLVQVKTPRPGPRNHYGYWLLKAEEQPRPSVAAVISWIKAEAATRRYGAADFDVPVDSHVAASCEHGAICA
jgi:DNA-binding transcriptional LysR family regulator